MLRAGTPLAAIGQVLRSFVAFCDAHGVRYLTLEAAVAWVTLPVGAQRSWLANRMTAPRGFASYLHAIDPRHHVIEADGSGSASLLRAAMRALRRGQLHQAGRLDSWLVRWIWWQ